MPRSARQTTYFFHIFFTFWRSPGLRGAKQSVRQTRQPVRANQQGSNHPRSLPGSKIQQAGWPAIKPPAQSWPASPNHQPQPPRQHSCSRPPQRPANQKLTRQPAAQPARRVLGKFTCQSAQAAWTTSTDGQQANQSQRATRASRSESANLPAKQQATKERRHAASRPGGNPGNQAASKASRPASHPASPLGSRRICLPVSKPHET